MRRIWNRLTRNGCEHPHTLEVTSVGIRRRVCEDCGHISFTMVTDNTTSRAKARTSLRKAAEL